MTFLLALMDWLEKTKQDMKSQEVGSDNFYFCKLLNIFVLWIVLQIISDEIVAQAHIENAAVKLFNWADHEDRCEHHNKQACLCFCLKSFSQYVSFSCRNVVKAFYSAGMLFDVCSVFGELNEDVAQQKKYLEDIT